MDAFTPQQTIELVSRIGTKKAHMRLDKLWWNAFMTGPLLGFGCAILVSTNAAPWYQENAPGLIRTIGALMFPVGLVMIVLSGSDLFTSNIMFMVRLVSETASSLTNNPAVDRVPTPKGYRHRRSKELGDFLLGQPCRQLVLHGNPHGLRGCVRRVRRL